MSSTGSSPSQSPIALAVDLVVLTVRDTGVRVLVSPRGRSRLALPGDFVRADESPADAAARVLRSAIGPRQCYVEQLATFADPGRDPRGWIPSVAHLALVPADSEPADASARWLSAAAAERRLVLDHGTMLATATERVRGKLWWSNVAVGILAGEFTLGEARHAYEAIAGTPYDPATFARDLRATGLIEPTGAVRAQTGGRPAALYRFRERAPVWGAGRRKRVRLDQGPPA
jgi:8-oxo-dGTP diphosphatase